MRPGVVDESAIGTSPGKFEVVCLYSCVEMDPRIGTITPASETRAPFHEFSQFAPFRMQTIVEDAELRVCQYFRA